MRYECVGICTSGQAWMFFYNVLFGLRNMLNDLGIIVLALLAHDRYHAVRNPQDYHANMIRNKARAWRCICAAILVVFVADGLRIFATRFQPASFSDHSMQIFNMVGLQIEFTYMSAALFV